MPEFARPDFPYVVDVINEKRRLTRHKKRRGVPRRADGELLIASWNVANFGAHDRRNEDRALIAHILAWFDVVALQECRENIGDLYDVVERMGARYQVVMSDVAGNDERMVYIFDKRKVSLLDEVGEIAVPPADHRHVRVGNSTQAFTGFDRNPYLASFKLKGSPLSVQLVNVHLYFGSETSREKLERRALETAAVARWVDLRSRSRFAGAREVIALGDFNMPKPTSAGGEIVYDALTSRGLVLPPHSTSIGSSIASDNCYDQVAMLPGTTRNWLDGLGVFDFDAVVYPDLWADGERERDFKAYLRYYLSDHRLLWVKLRPPAP